jgi:hypothetical protein
VNGWEVHTGDCLDVLPTLKADSVDAVVCDPPYGLSFMGRAWDHGVPGEPFWREALRVAKPGAHLLAFGGTRTFHRLTCAIEDSGWEVRDCLMWLTGQGFPKSLDVSKAIDRQRHDRDQVRTVCRWIRSSMESSGVTSKNIADVFGFHPRMADHWAARDTDSQPAVPTLDQVPTLLGVLGLTLEDVPEDIRDLIWTLNGRKGQPGEAWFRREVVGTRPGLNGSGFGNVGHGLMSEPDRIEDTLPATDAAKQWHGWGTALKPAWEPIILARKPLDGTVANNVLTHGCGGINVDGCRVGTDGGVRCVGLPSGRPGNALVGSANGTLNGQKTEPTGSGRWPANLLLDPAAAAMLDEQAGERGTSRPGECADSNDTSRRSAYAMGARGFRQGYGDTGGASRFFYTAKASKSDRGADNTHPTVKPTDLMRWLVRLVTPPNGLVLDPFCGSGTTGVACIAEGCGFVGIEQDPEHADLARERIGAEQPTLF